jgi:hypothetical protein
LTEEPKSRDDEKPGAINSKDVYYMLRDVKEGFEMMGSRLDKIEENQAASGEGAVSDMPAIPGGAKHRSVQERAAWQTGTATQIRTTATAVSATRTRADQQSHTLGILEELQYLGDLGDEKFLGFASLIGEKWLLEHQRRGKSYLQYLKTVGLLIIGAVAIIVIGEGVFQPQNFQSILTGLSDPRTAAIVLALVGTFAGLFLYFWLRERRQSKQKPGAVNG